MRWSIIRLIWLRELRDQLRDRRTILMIVVLPLVLYPLLGVGVVQFALGFVEKPSVVGIIGSEHLPGAVGAYSLASWIASAAPATRGAVLPADPVLAFAPLIPSPLDFPPLLVQGGFFRAYFDSPAEARALQAILLGSDWQEALGGKQVDLILVVPPDFRAQLEWGGRPELQFVTHESDERSRQASNRLHNVLAHWKQQLRAVRLIRRDLPPQYDNPFSILDPERAKTFDTLAAEGLVDVLVRIFPFMLVMWSLAGALYPAIDLCAGEKERGTMETLLISPASREEIVWGKFLTIWVFSAATALLNLLSMCITAWQLSGQITQAFFPATALFWSVVLALPLSAFFSALCLSLGAYARSSKEGQYYLMPLFLLTMPLIFLTLAPGVELNQFYSLVPVTGVALLMQELMAARLDTVRWPYFIPVLASITLYSWLALRWAIEQFKREEVLFREAERLDLGLWLKRLFREKETLPSAGQAFFCFALILALRWFALGLGGQRSALVHTGISSLAFVGTPPLIMAVLLTNWPRRALALGAPAWGTLPAAILLAALLFLPLAELRYLILQQFPTLADLLSQRQLLNENLALPPEGQHLLDWNGIRTLMLLVLTPGICEEVAFRGFILNGLRRWYRPWTAILLSALLFGLYTMNVVQFIPAFLLGLALGILATRSGSIVPGILFHLTQGAFLLAASFVLSLGDPEEPLFQEAALRPVVALVCGLLALLVLAALAWGLSGRRVAVAPHLPQEPS